MSQRNPTSKWLNLTHLLSGKYQRDRGVFRDATEGNPFFNRNLSWLHFNDRVLMEAADPTTPPLERLKFLGIVSSNLDEFFMIRVAEVMRAVRRNPAHRFMDGYTALQLLAQIRDHVNSQKSRQADIFKQVAAVLNKERIHIYSEFTHDHELDKEIRAHLPEVKFIIRRDTDPFPALTSDQIHVFVRFPGEYAIISIADREARLLELPPHKQAQRYVLLERWLAQRAKKFFPARRIREAFSFKLIRDADLRYRPDEDDTLEEQILEAVQKRLKAKIVRLEVDAHSYSEAVFYLSTALSLDSASLYRFNMPLDLRTLATIAAQKEGRRLCYAPIQPRIPPQWKSCKSFLSLVKKKDMLLHHPYDSFDLVIQFLEEAASDPHVTRITHTLYRTSKESPVMEALKTAAINGKKVRAYVEIKARFDELNNVRWANELRKAGVRVINPLGGFKVHSKMTQVLRREGDKEISYLHLGTGNYHPATARQYTDLSLFTCNQELGDEVKDFFSHISKRKNPQGYRHLLVSPGTLHDQMVRLIKNETRIQKNGGRGRIIAKMNSLVDKDIIKALYEASQAGVRIELVVRGICCLKPGIKGLSDNIRVTSVIDRFLEHSRVFNFRANGEQKLYLSSADWMPRNFFSRYEIAYPVLDPTLNQFIRDTLLQNYLDDNLKAWELKPDGSYVKIQPKVNDTLVRSQLSFEVLSRKNYHGTALEKRGRY